MTDSIRPVPIGEPVPEELLVQVYDELRRLAKRYLRNERAGHTLQTTALVHEAWTRLGASEKVPLDRARFLCASAVAMRRVLVDHAREKARLKRGGRGRRITFHGDEFADGSEVPTDVVALNGALEELARRDPLKARLVELRYFLGLPRAEAAATLGISLATLKREWTAAKAWLLLSLEEGGAADRGER